MEEDTTTSKDSFDGILHLYTTEILGGNRGGSTYQVAADASLLGKYAVGRWMNHMSGASGYSLY